jgi:hypothetical protein
MRTLNNDSNPILMILWPLGTILFWFILWLLLSYRLKVLWRNRAFKYSLDIQSLYNQSFDNKLLIREEEKENFGLYELQTNNEKAYWENIKKEIILWKNISINNIIDNIWPRKVSYSWYQNSFIILAWIICIAIAAYFIYLKESEQQFIYLFLWIWLVSVFIWIYRSIRWVIFILSEYGIEKESHWLIAWNQIYDIGVVNRFTKNSSYYEFIYHYNWWSENINISELDIWPTELEMLLKKYIKWYKTNL